jgi:putative DNA primase/helicase
MDEYSIKINNFNTGKSLLEAMKEANLPWPGNEEPVFDGQFHTFTDPESSSKPLSNKAAWFKGEVLPDSGIKVAVFGSYRRPEQGTHHWSSEPLNAESKAEADRIRAEAEVERQKLHEEAAVAALQEWESATVVKGNEHPYLQKKQVSSNGVLRVTGEVLLVPFRDIHGNLHTLTRIWPDGVKRNFPNGATKNFFCTLGPKPKGEIILATGIATAMVCCAARGISTCAVGSDSNLASVAKVLRQRFPAAVLTIAADLGTSGQNASLAALKVAGSPARVVSPVFAAGAASNADFNDLMQAEGITVVQQQLAVPAPKAAGPDPLRREPPAPEPFPLEVLGPVLHPAALALSRIIGAPDAMIAQSLLAAAAYCVQGHVNVSIDGRISPTSLFFITIGNSGERKSAVDTQAIAPITERQRELVAEYRGALNMHRKEKIAFDQLEKQAMKGKIVDLQEIKDIRQAAADADMAGEPPEAPLLPNLLCADPTYEGLTKLFAIGQPSLGLFSDEGGLMIGGVAMQKESRLRTIAALSKLWDGRPLDRVRAVDGASLLFDRRLSLHLMMQPLVASELFSDPIFIDQGFLSRTLCAWPTSTAGFRRYTPSNPADDVGMIQYWAALRRLLVQPWQVREDCRNELEPRNLPLSVAAKIRWISYHDDIESQLGDGQILAPVRGFAAKAAEQAARLAAVLTIIENFEAMAIEIDALEAGIALMDYYLTEMLRLHESGVANPEITQAERLLEWLQTIDSRYVYLAQIYQHGPYGVRDAETARKLLKLLEAHHWVAYLEEGKVIDGIHRRNVWELTFKGAGK